VNINEPEITREELLLLKDDQFNENNVCIVTGSGKGIGRAMAIAAAANNLVTVGLDIDEAEGRRTEEMARKIGGHIKFIKTDLCNDNEIKQAVHTASQMGTIKYLANIAGVQHVDSVEDFPMEKYDLMLRLMLRAPFYLSKLCIPHMKKSNGGTGVIGNMASIHAHICTRNKPAYNITKFGLRALTQSISAEGEGKIRAFTISTGFVKTSLALDQIPSQAEQRGITPDEVVTDVMMGRSRIKEMMTPVEVANQFIYAFSNHAKYLIGGDFLLDGGTVLTY